MTLRVALAGGRSSRNNMLVDDGRKSHGHSLLNQSFMCGSQLLRSHDLPIALFGDEINSIYIIYTDIVMYIRKWVCMLGPSARPSRGFARPPRGDAQYIYQSTVSHQLPFIHS